MNGGGSVEEGPKRWDKRWEESVQGEGSVISGMGCESAWERGKRQAAWCVRLCGQEPGRGSCGGELGFPLSCGNREPLKGF